MYDPKIARFLQEDTYRGDPNDPLSLNLYAYTANNPITYYDPTGHNYIKIGPLYLGNPIEGFRILSNSEEREKAYELIEEYGDLGFVGKRVYSIAAGYGEISAGMINTGRDVLDSGYVQKPMLEVGRKFGFIDNDLVYEMMREEIDKKLERNKKTLKNAPKAIYDGIIESADNVFNKENAYNFFINPDTSFDELVDYSRDTISTGLTIYSGAKLLQSGHNLLKGISFETTPSAVTPLGQVLPTVPSIAIEAGLAGNFAASAGFFGGVNFATTNGTGLELKVPGRVQSRINLRKGSVKEGAGFDHVLDRHFNPSKNASQFTITPDELKSILQSKNVVNTPVTRILESSKGARYLREVNLQTTIGLDKFNNFQPTNTMTVLTDKFGNLVTATPGVIK